jgi:molybdenum cofactor cytidylyltransferase
MIDVPWEHIKNILASAGLAEHRRRMRVSILLAAGSSRRFGRRDKLLAPFRGKPLVVHALRIAEAAPTVRTNVATDARGPRLPLLRNRAAARTSIVAVPRPEEGIAASIRAAFAALRPCEREVFLFLGDMPLVPPVLARRLLPLRGLAKRPSHRGRPGHPVLLRRPSAQRLAALTGDQGLGRLIARDALRLEGGPGCVLDLDTGAELLRLGLAWHRTR